MTKSEQEDYVQRVIGRVHAEVTADARFLYAFKEKYAVDIEEGLGIADATRDTSYIEEELDYWVEKARQEFLRGSNNAPSLVADDVNTWKRQETLANYVKAFAADDPLIRRFREQILGGRTLTEKEALEFISSPYTADREYKRTTRRYNRNAFLKPIKVEEKQENEKLYKEVVVRGKRKPITRKVSPLMLTHRGLFFPGDVATDWDLALPRWAFHLRYFQHPIEERCYIVAREKSVLAELSRLSETQLIGYPVRPEKVLWFILTGEFIPSEPARVRYETLSHPEFERTKITLEVEAWMPAEEVAKHYRYAQRQILGKTPRSLNSSDLDLIDFVHSNESKPRKEQFKKWNEKHPSRPFSQQGHLQQAYKRALGRLTGLENHD